MKKKTIDLSGNAILINQDVYILMRVNKENGDFFAGKPILSIDAEIEKTK